MNADLWGLVLRFALRLDLLDRSCLATIRNCARVCKAASMAVWRLDKTELRLRVRVHRLFGFQDPTKSQVRVLFPDFTEDPVYSSAPRGQRLSLPRVSARLVSCAAAVSKAEQRPSRIEARKRCIEQEAEAVRKRQKFLQQALDERGLPFESSDQKVRDFVSGRSKTPDSALKAMTQLRTDRFVQDYVAARTVKLGFDPGLSSKELLRKQVDPIVVPSLETSIVLRVGQALLAADDLTPERETALWLAQTKAVIKRFENSLKIKRR
jgi:hypothetical protein